MKRVGGYKKPTSYFVRFIFTGVCVSRTIQISLQVTNRGLNLPTEMSDDEYQSGASEAEVCNLNVIATFLV